MYRWSRLISLAVTLASVATEARAVEVALQLASATYTDCEPDYFGDGESCLPSVAATLLPAVPQGSGSVIDVDAAGVVIRAIVQLEGFSLEGVPVAPWTGTYNAIPGYYATFEPELLALPGHGQGAWYVSLTRMTDQSDFAGELTVFTEQHGPTSNVRHWRLTFPFTAIATGAPPPCEGELLYLDDDGDGKVNSRDLQGGDLAGVFGDAIDSAGRTPWEFCYHEGHPDLSWRRNRCERLDYRNDEPLRRRPGDCQRNPSDNDSGWECAPAEFVYRSQPPAAPSRTCLGFGVVDDADGDGEPDTTDRCASTPRGAGIDGDGCSTEQFCSQQSVQVCRRADFRNDEPLSKQPRDCARTKSEPRTCAAATLN